MDAARYLAGGVIDSGFEIDEAIVKQYRDMGAPDEFIESLKAKAQQQQDFELFEDCVESVEVFQAMRTQWRTRGMDGALIGLDYTPLPFVMRMRGVALARRADVFEDLRVMEIETLKVIQEKQP